MDCASGRAEHEHAVGYSVLRSLLLARNRLHSLQAVVALAPLPSLRELGLSHSAVRDVVPRGGGPGPALPAPAYLLYIIQALFL